MLTLSVSAQVDGARLDVNVHKVVNDSTLGVILDLVHEEPTAHVDDFNKRQVPESTEKITIRYSAEISLFSRINKYKYSSDGWMDKWMGGWEDGRTDGGWIDG